MEREFNFKRQLAVILILISVLAILMLTPYGAWAEEHDHWKRDVVRWTRHYEQRMGIARSLTVRFSDYVGAIPNGTPEGDEICGLMQDDGILYSESTSCRKAYRNVRALAVHEVCHWRMQHNMTNLPRPQAENEVAACVLWYGEVKRR